MFLSDFSVKRPTVATVASLLLVVFGLISFTQVPLRQYPDVDPPVVSVTTTYPGASAAIIDTQITRVLEDQFDGIDGIKYVDSISRDSYSRITIEFEVERSLDVAVNDVQQAIGRIVEQLPDEANTPSVRKSDSDAMPLMFFTLTGGGMSELELSDYAKRVIIDRLSIIDGVARVVLGGGREYAIRIDLDRRKMAARNLTVNDIENALRSENVELPAGEVESVWRTYSARIERVYQSPEDFERLVIRRGEDGHLVRLGEVADVALRAANEKSFFRRDGIDSVALGVIKQSQANAMDVSDAVKAEVESLRHILPEGIELVGNYDASIFIERAIEEVYFTLAVAVLLVVLVIYLFLGNVRATLVPAITVPISLISAFIFVYMAGFSINILTLLALVLAIGLVVDDTIVMLENIHSRMERGEPAMLAAYRGARQVGFAIVATTLVLVAVFVPLVFLQGNIGRLFTEFSLTMAAAVVFSSFVALTLSPVLCSALLKPTDHYRSPMAGILNALEKGYDRVLRAEGRSVGPLVLILGLAVLAIAVLFDRLPSEFVPEEDGGFIFVFYEGPQGASFEHTRETVLQLEKRIMAQKEQLGIRQFLLRAPSFWGGDQPNSGMGIVVLKPWEERELSAMEIRDRLYGVVSDVPGGQTYFVILSGLAPGAAGQPVQVVIGADTYQDLAQWRETMLAQARQNPVLRNANIDFAVDAQQLQVEVDQARAADLGVSVQSVGRALETMLASRTVTTFLDRGEEYDVMLEGLEVDVRSPDEMGQIYVRSERTGRLIPLANLVTIEEVGTSPELPRYNRRRAMTLNADIASGYSMDDALAEVRQMVSEQLPASASLDYKGAALEYVRAGSSVLFVFGIAVLVAYLVMAAQFESFLHPLLILLTVPLAIGGALFGLYVTGQSLNVFSQIGLVMLIGLAAKNGILIVEFANQKRDEGLPFDEALYSAALQRLRPILMTSLTTVFGAVPLLLASGAGAEARFVLGVVVFFGVLVATLLTIFVLPAAYLKFARRGNTPGRLAKKIGRLEESVEQEF